MNIANIMGLHLGCMVRCKGSRLEYTGELRKVEDEWVGAKGEIAMFEIKDCKLILKPLSKITDEDKAEFQKKYVKFNDFVSRSRVEFYNNLSYDVYTRSTSGWSENIEYKLSIDQLLWLASKGYDIGLVPDEYKEVAE
jgi:hypothetical protein